MPVMPQKGGQRTSAAEPFSGDKLIENILATQFRVYNRVAATKPLGRLLELIGLDEGLAPVEVGDYSADDGKERHHAWLHVASAFQPKLFGIRLGLRIESEKNLFVVDGAVEYRWKQAVNYERKQLLEFVQSEAAQRAAVATTTVVGEVAQSQRTNLGSEMVIGFMPVANEVMNQFETFQRRTASAIPKLSKP